MELLKDVCLSGGAEGSDTMWGTAAKYAGHSVIHWSFPGHKCAAPTEDIVVLSNEQLAAADPHCALANETLHRSWPPKSHGVRNLLRRNYYQVESATSCYAISTFKLPAWVELGKELDGGVVAGGTAWAVEMFLQKYKHLACACFVFDQDICNWFEWRGKWVRIYEPPKPKGIYAGIGTRKTNSVGLLAIKVLMDYQQDYH